MLYTLRFFSSKCSLFHNANLFGSCIIHILYTWCAKIKKKKLIPAPKGYPVSRLVSDCAPSNFFCYALVCGLVDECEWCYFLSWFYEVALRRFVDLCVYLLCR